MQHPRVGRRVDAAIALIARRGRYLICRRLRSAVLGGRWEFPGGKRKPRERWAACLRRELREELGVAVRDLQLVGTLRHRYPHAAVTLRVFRCAITRGLPRPRQAQALRWVRPAALARYRFPPANRPVLEFLRGPRVIIAPTTTWTSPRQSPARSSPSRRRRPPSRR